MSKETFSQKISESIQRKIEAIEIMNIDDFLEPDENFEIALCLSYMTLSKEKIIAKDIKNQNRLDRLSQMVNSSEINKVFQNGFAKEMPLISYAKENNNLWILDNIRDSIMHGAFDIDDKRKCFLINNNQYDRELIAEIPFSWFIAYAKNDILSEKVLDNYTVRGFYYNRYKKGKNTFYTNKELINNILYCVNIKGNKFNIRNIERRTKELFEIYSKQDINNDLIQKYKDKINNEKIKYNEKYLVSFYIASEKVKEVLEKEFVGCDVSIFINNRKHKLVNKASRRLPMRYFDYELMYNDFNKMVSSKGIDLLKYLSNIIENLNSNFSNHDNSYFNIVNQFNILLNGEEIKYDNNINIFSVAKQNLNVLREIILSVYGLSTLVINHENLYNQHFFNQHPSKYGIRACLKSSYLEYAQKRKNIIIKILENEISLFLKQNQFNCCNDSNAKVKIQQMINNLQAKNVIYENELYSLSSNVQFDRIIKFDAFDHKKMEKLENIINGYFTHFYEATTVAGKNKVKKIINHLLDVQMEEESKYTYGYCNNMREVLTIIRNCFSHIGRVTVGKNRGGDTSIILNDYDSNNEKSGEVVCKYNDLIHLLNEPYIYLEQNVKEK